MGRIFVYWCTVCANFIIAYAYIEESLDEGRLAAHVGGASFFVSQQRL